MAAVLQYTNRKGEQYLKTWKVSKERKFTALIKCYVQYFGEKTLQVIEKPSLRPATFHECYMYAQKLKKEYGDNLKQMIIWNLDEPNMNSDY